MNYSANITVCKDVQSLSHSTRTARVSAIALVSAFGISGNIFVILLAVKYTVRKNLHHLIINMAVSDILVILTMPLQSASSQLNLARLITGMLGEILCKTTVFVFHLSVKESLLTLLIISIERFRATRLFARRLQPYTLRQRVAVLVSCWSIAMFISAFHIYFSITSSSPSGGNFCGDPFLLEAVIFMNIYFIFVIILFCIIFSLSILTLRRLLKPQAIEASLAEAQRQARRKRITAAVRMVLCSLLLYSCCWLPYIIYYFLWTLSFTLEKAHSLYVIPICIDWSTLIFILSNILPLVNSCFSPCIYIVFLSDFREAAKRLVCTCRTTNRSVNKRNAVELEPVDNREIQPEIE